VGHSRLDADGVREEALMMHYFANTIKLPCALLITHTSRTVGIYKRNDRIAACIMDCVHKCRLFLNERTRDSVQHNAVSTADHFYRLTVCNRETNSYYCR